LPARLSLMIAWSIIFLYLFCLSLNRREAAWDLIEVEEIGVPVLRISFPLLSDVMGEVRETSMRVFSWLVE
jgi:hypothetical protein